MVIIYTYNKLIRDNNLKELGIFADQIEGNYFTVVGLPIYKLYEVIKKYI